ncbi:IclR family transcriptional regulator [Roseomonas sp. GC11]|uniref:IclR family transcriptional regulator n=1 Tax=Roseomonas sp. GC11 TaxID=2950546 RepID=UPI00210A3AFC|nr:IclR family transcriptional regulator [Roseomonas sp. GC11]
MSQTDPNSSLHRALGLLRLLGRQEGAALRLTDIATAAGLPRPTAHRMLRALTAEGFLDYDAQARRYRLGIELFQIAARAGAPQGLRDLARPALLRLTAALGETLFLLVHNGYDAVCIERSAGPLPIRSFTGDIGGHVPLGLGQGSVAILAFLPPDEQDEIIRHNLQRLTPYDRDEASLRAEIAQVRREGHAGGAAGVIPGMAGLAVPVLAPGPEGRAVAALSVGTVTERLTPERRCAIAAILKREAAQIAARLNPFDPALRRAGAAMEHGAAARA